MQANTSAVIHPEAPSQTKSGFPVERLRSQFPALHREPQFTFFDNAAGAQIPQIVLDAVNHHLLDHNVQRGGRYAKSIGPSMKRLRRLGRASRNW